MPSEDQIPTGPRADRSRGDCRMCCKAMGVPEFKKLPGVWCEHAGDHPGGGCGIHEDRPQSCRDFFCAWRNDHLRVFADEDRPDHLGVVFWVMADGGYDPVTKKKFNVLVAQEGTKGAALQRPRVRKLIERLRRRGAPVSVGYGHEIVPVALTRDGRMLLDHDRVMHRKDWEE